MSGMGELLLALDFGGTKHTAATITKGERQWQAHRRAFAPANGNAQSDLDIMLTLARDVLNGAQPAAIGVSFGGPVDARYGVVRLSHHVAGWENFPLRDWLREKFNARRDSITGQSYRSGFDDAHG